MSTRRFRTSSVFICRLCLEIQGFALHRLAIDGYKPIQIQRLTSLQDSINPVFALPHPRSAGSFFMRPLALMPPWVFSNFPLITNTFAKRPRAILETRLAFITDRLDLLFLSEACFANAMMWGNTRVRLRQSHKHVYCDTWQLE